jgi:succinate-semialdehyde dehydrogenase/glutarate-semialdehyde dehydrogenase
MLNDIKKSISLINETKGARKVLQLNDINLFRQQCYVDGTWMDAYSGERMAVLNPADGKTLGSVPSMGAEEVRLAVGRAYSAWPAWRGLTAGERADSLRRWFNLMLLHQEDLACLMTAEQGKPLTESRGEIAYAASFVEWFAEEGRRIYGDLIPAHQGNLRLAVLKEPVGVCAAITPWNFPAAMITRKASAALAAGCPMVVKPASLTPFSALALAELAHRAGLPAGVFNVITGPSTTIGAELTAHPRIRKLSFTGSTAVGKMLMAQCAASVKKISLELGGNAPFIVFEDADLDAAVAGAMASKYRNSGQTCVCANRLLIQDKVYDAFVQRLVPAVRALTVADGFAEDAQQGPLIDMAAVAKVEHLIADALENGARLLTGGLRHKLGGTFFEPTVLGQVNRQMQITKEEAFGPVAPLMRFSDEDEAVALANDTEYGLAAYFYTRDLGRMWRVAEKLECGMVGVNTGIISTASAPFGGVKQSGIGREGSRYGIDEYLEIKYLCIGGIQATG